VFTRERKEGMYQVLPFFVAKAIAEYPFEALFTCAFWGSSYWLSGLNPNIYRFLISIGIMYLTRLCSQYLGYVFAALFPSLATSQMASNVTFTIFILTTGWVVNYKDMFFMFQWIPKISYLKYGYTGFCLAEYKGLKFYCKKDQLVNGYCPIQNGEQVLDRLSMSDDHISSSFYFLGGFLVFLTLIFVLLLKFKSQAPK
jgi:hypothetical protein